MEEASQIDGWKLHQNEAYSREKHWKRGPRRYFEINMLRLCNQFLVTNNSCLSVIKSSAFHFLIVNWGTKCHLPPMRILCSTGHISCTTRCLRFTKSMWVKLGHDYYFYTSWSWLAGTAIYQRRETSFNRCNQCEPSERQSWFQTWETPNGESIFEQEQYGCSEMISWTAH